MKESKTEPKIETKICILNCDISDSLQEKIDNASLNFEKDITLDNFFVELRFQDINADGNPIVIDVISSKNNKNIYLNKLKKDFTIVQISFFMIEEHNRPYLITRGETHIVTKGLSILFTLQNLVIDDDLNTVQNAIIDVIDKMIYLDDNKSYFGGNGFIDFFKHNRLKYKIRAYGNGFNNPGNNKANYIFFTYSVLVEDEKISKHKNKRTFFLYQDKDKKVFFHDIFDIAPINFENGFKAWYESLGKNNIKCKFCFEGSYDIALLISYVYVRQKTSFKKAFFKKNDNSEVREYISKYENLFLRMRKAAINSVKDTTIQAFIKIPEKIIYGLLTSILVVFLTLYIKEIFFLKVILYFLGFIVLLPISRIIVEFIVKAYIFFIPNNQNNKDES